MVLTFISISHVSILRPSFGVIETIRPVKVVSSRAEALLLLRRVILFHSEKNKNYSVILSSTRSVLWNSKSI